MRNYRCAELDWCAFNCGGTSGCGTMPLAAWQMHSPAGRVVRRAGSSSRRSGACRRAAAGASAASASSSSAGSIAPLHTVGAPASSRSRPRAHYFRRALGPNECSERSNGEVRESSASHVSRLASRVSEASLWRDGWAGLSRAPRDFPAHAARGPARPSRKTAKRPTTRGRGKLQPPPARAHRPRSPPRCTLHLLLVCLV